MQGVARCVVRIGSQLSLFTGWNVLLLLLRQLGPSERLLDRLLGAHPFPLTAFVTELTDHLLLVSSVTSHPCRWLVLTPCLEQRSVAVEERGVCLPKGCSLLYRNFASSIDTVGLVPLPVSPISTRAPRWAL